MPDDDKKKLEDKKPEGDSELAKIKATLAEVIADRNALKLKLKETSSSLEQFQIDAQKRAKDLETRKAKDEQAKLESEGKYQEALAQTTSKYETQISQLKSSIAQRLVPNAIRSAAAKVANIDPSALEDLPLLLNGRIRLNEETLDVFVADDEGKPMQDDKLAQVGLDDFVKDFVSKRPRMIIDKQVTGTGFVPGSGTGKEQINLSEAMKDPKLIAQWRKEDPASLDAAVSQTFFSDPKAMAKKALGME